MYICTDRVTLSHRVMARGVISTAGLSFLMNYGLNNNINKQNEHIMYGNYYFMR